MTLEPSASHLAPVDPGLRFAYAVLSRAAHTDPAHLADLPGRDAVRQAAHRLTVEAGSQGRALAAQADADLAAADRAGARLITREDPGWPAARLAALATSGVRAAPIAMWARGNGDLGALTRRALFITGSRAATSYGEAVATEFVTELHQCGWTVITGGGYGIEAAAHRAALAEAAPALLISAAGIDHAYPHQHEALFNRVAHAGLILTETPPGAIGLPPYFERRSAVLAALAQRFVVVEAARRGQALRTAVLAHLLGTPVFAVPGRITSPQSGGCHDLIAAGQATLTRSIADILADTETPR